MVFLSMGLKTGNFSAQQCSVGVEFENCHLWGPCLDGRGVVLLVACKFLHHSTLCNK